MTIEGKIKNTSTSYERSSHGRVTIKTGLKKFTDLVRLSLYSVTATFVVQNIRAICEKFSQNNVKILTYCVEKVSRLKPNYV
jgi:hypothetical protein